jgi:hypothetical protein
MNKRYNWSAAFAEYAGRVAKGIEDKESLRQTGEALGIPEGTMTLRAHRDEWQSLVAFYQQPTGGCSSVVVQVDAERAVARIQENREKNLVVIAKLQDDLLLVVQELLNGTLTTTKQTPKGTLVKMPAGIKERLDLVNYAKGVQELSYRALGDAAPSRSDTSGGPGGAEAGQITIVLPTVVAAPRDQREFSPDQAKVVEV